MAGAKLVVMYPMPKDMAAFEQAYSAEHIPMAAAIFKAAGATRAVLPKVVKAAAGSAAVHRGDPLPSMEALQACTASQAGADVLGDFREGFGHRAPQRETSWTCVPVRANARKPSCFISKSHPSCVNGAAIRIG